MINIPLTELEKLLVEVKSAKPVTFVAITDARANKKSVEPDPTTGEKIPNPYDMILKKTRVNGFIGYDYEAAVNRQRAREGEAQDFTAQERTWGSVVSPALSEKDGKRYLRVKVQSYLESEYFGVNGTTMVPITKDQAKVFIREKKSSGNQGVEKEVDHKEYLLSNVESITMDGQAYTLLRG
jgi:hypothetical protein